jgi:hypothetical protein
MMQRPYCTFFGDFIGKTLGGSEVGTEGRETAREGIRWKVVHASRGSLKGAGIRKRKIRSIRSIRNGKGQADLWWYAGIKIGMNRDGYDTIRRIHVRHSDAELHMKRAGWILIGEIARVKCCVRVWVSVRPVGSSALRTSHGNDARHARI